MYEIVLFIHSWWRWVLVFLLVFVFLRSLWAFKTFQHFSRTDFMLGGFLLGAAHFQLLIGFVLYFVLSPITKLAIQNFGFAMKSSSLRFWALEHVVFMVIFVFLIQISRIISKKAPTDLQKHKRTFVCTGLALLVFAAGVPWEFRKDIARPSFMEFHTRIEKTP
jgi:hypothetical protein